MECIREEGLEVKTNPVFHPFDCRRHGSTRTRYSDAIRWRLRRLFVRASRVKLSLGEKEMVAVEPAGMCEIECLSGEAWITVAGNSTDFRLVGGERLVFSNGGKTVIVGTGDGANLVLRI